jgi:type IV secretory pathway TrbD component
MCAVLYALVGWLSYLGVFTPVLGVVRFWPSVFVPAVFAIAFSPYVGGVGAAIGIFISDMMIHGNALLSLTVGVPANFVGFYLTGALYRRVRSSALPVLVAEVAASLLVLALLYSWGAVPQDLLAAGGVAAAVTLALALLFKGEDRAIVLAGSTGLLAGSAIVGAGVWLFSQFFTLPTGGSRLPIVAAAVWFAWTYFTEVPFIALLTPPIVKALRRASLAHQ